MKIGDFVTVKIPKGLEEKDCKNLKNYLNIIFQIINKETMNTVCLHAYQKMSFWNKEPFLYNLLSANRTYLVITSDFLQLVKDERILDTIF